MPGDPLLVVKDLTVHFPTSDGIVKAVDGLCYTVERGKTLGHRGRVRLRQVGVELGDPRACTTAQTAQVRRARSSSTASTS